MAYRFGDVLLATLTFADQQGAKKRPVVVVHDCGDADLLVVPATSHAPRSAEDVVLGEWSAAGLQLASTLRMAKLATLSKTNVVRTLGRLSNADARAARVALSRFFSTMLS